MCKLGLIPYPEVKLFQFLLRHIDIIPTKYKKTYKKWKNCFYFSMKQYVWLKFTGKTNMVNIFPKMSKSVMWSTSKRRKYHFPANENNFGFPGKLASGDLNFFENFYQNKKALLFGLQKIKMQVSISSITIPSAHPQEFTPKICPHPGAFAS